MSWRDKFYFIICDPIRRMNCTRRACTEAVLAAKIKADIEELGG